MKRVGGLTAGFFLLVAAGLSCVFVNGVWAGRCLVGSYFGVGLEPLLGLVFAGFLLLVGRFVVLVVWLLLRGMGWFGHRTCPCC